MNQLNTVELKGDKGIVVEKGYRLVERFKDENHERVNNHEEDNNEHN